MNTKQYYSCWGFGILSFAIAILLLIFKSDTINMISNVLEIGKPNGLFAGMVFLFMVVSTACIVVIFTNKREKGK